MLDAGLPILLTLLAWWLGTALVFWLGRLPQRSERWTLPGTVAASLGACYGLAATRDLATAGGAYAAFGCALVLWGCLEIAYYSGRITGPRPEACPPGGGDWQRFGYALQASVYHEASVIGAAALVAWLVGDGANAVGLWTFMILWWMRWSAKLNLFLGVPNLYDGFLPQRLRYLRSYMARRRMNLLFPISVSVPLVVAGILIQHALAPAAGAFEVAGACLLAALLALAVLEHWFFVLPLPELAIWGWAVPRARGSR
jgi:putative photosynthetic complex assembly protein 2